MPQFGILKQILYMLPVNTLLTYADIGIFLIRLVVAFVFIYHALPKLSTPEKISKMMGGKMSSLMIVLLGVVEFIASINLIIGSFFELSTILLSVVLLGAIFTKIFIWDTNFSSATETGWEFDLVLLVVTFSLFLTGAGLMTAI